MKKIEYTKHEIIGNNGIKYFKDAALIIYNSRKSRAAIFICPLCNNYFIASINTIKYNLKKDCGCIKKYGVRGKKHHNYTDGRTNNKYYKLWLKIISKCYNKNDPAYHYYGSRNISLYKFWKNDFWIFAEYIKNLPNATNKNLTLDRINNDGNYEPNNLRWVNMHFQNCNRRSNKKSNSYIGVYFNKSHNKYIANIKINGTTKYLGRFDNELNALYIRNKYITDNNLKEYKIQIQI